MGLFIMTGVFGPEYWSEDFLIGGIKVKIQGMTCEFDFRIFFNF